MKLVDLPNKHWAGLDLQHPQIMGILNVTPDSFSDGGRYTQRDRAVLHAEQMIREGATIIDIGGESTRPDAALVSVQEELERVIPAVEALRHHAVKLSIDTSSPEVIREAVAHGAHIWNDVRALTRPGALSTAAKLDIPVILMHMRGEPATMNQLADYEDVVEDMCGELQQRVDAALAAGVKQHQILLDPGFGFAKTTDHNLSVLDQFWQLHSLGYPLLAGLSRKRFIGEVLQGAAAHERDIASATGHLLAVQQGASVVRTHAVKPLADMLKLWTALSLVE